MCEVGESKFVTILNGPLKAAIGLNEQEIAELADYFRVQDGRILYNQFCEVIHDSVPKFANNAPLVTGLEWEDPFHVNSLSVLEERRLHLLLSKIASLVNLRKLILRPYFQDYELISKNNGTVTIDHFARVLNYLGIMVSAEDFNLLVKKFVKDSYTLNYVAFVAYLDQIIKYMDRKQLLDLGGDVLLQWPGRAISAELPKLPRPEIGKIRAASIFGLQSIFHPALEPPAQCEDLERLIRRIQQHIYYNRIRTTEFFKFNEYVQRIKRLNEEPPKRTPQSKETNIVEILAKIKGKVVRERIRVIEFMRDFDRHNQCVISRDEFWRGLDACRFNLSPAEVETLMEVFASPFRRECVDYQRFCETVEEAVTQASLERAPLITPLQHLPSNDCDRNFLNFEERHTVSMALEKIAGKHNLNLMYLFQNYDRVNCGTVTRDQFTKVLAVRGLTSVISSHELEVLQKCFGFERGLRDEVDYRAFCRCLELLYTTSYRRPC